MENLKCSIPKDKKIQTPINILNLKIAHEVSTKTHCVQYCQEKLFQEETDDNAQWRTQKVSEGGPKVSSQSCHKSTWGMPKARPL